jgi:hypothetical protein
MSRKPTVTAGIRALPFVLMMTTGSTYAFGQPDFARLAGELRSGRRLTCYPIRPGDTAARLAQRFTGNAHNRHQAWFQIVNPTTETFIPKSHYGLIQAGWHVCVATEMLRRGSARPRYHVVASGPPVLLQTSVAQKQTAIDLSVLWWATSLLLVVSGLMLAWVVAGKYIGERQASLAAMRGFGDRFISEFERPLFRRCAGEPSVKSRLRFTPRRHTLEVLLAPADGRTYPNLFDHRKNVEYDVERVLHLLRDAPFTNGPLYAEGPWVVIPFRLETDRQQEGVP